MTIELYFRNPTHYVNELKEVGPQAYRVAWDRGILIKKGIEPVKWAQMYFGAGSNWQAMMIGEQGTVHLDQDHDLASPLGVYPTWTGKEDISVLEEMMINPLGEDEKICDDDSIPVDIRPVFGQRHIVVIAEMPNSTLGTSRALYAKIKELNEDHPECELFLHGSYSYRLMFDQGFALADFEPRTSAAKKKVQLPTGKEVGFERVKPQWASVLGMSVGELTVPRMRCIYNIRSALWARENWESKIAFATRSSSSVNVTPGPGGGPPSNRTTKALPAGAKAKAGDKNVCDACSLQDDCKFYREGAVCSLPESDTATLADYFKSRDASKIIDALGTVVGAQSERLERGIREEETLGEMDPHVSKEINNLFNNGRKLALLVDPSLGKPLVQINNGGQATQIAQRDPREVAAEVIKALEATGIPRAEITNELFQGMLMKMTGQTAEVPRELGA